MSEKWWEKDSDGDGTPDVIEEAQQIKSRFGTKTILVTMLVGLIVAGYGVGGFFYLDLQTKYATLQQQYDWQETEDEIELTAQVIAEHKQQLKDLRLEAEDLKKDVESKRNARLAAENIILEKPFARRNEDEANKMDINELVHGFNALGFPAKSSSSVK